jgi:photosystem II stability/assembly factor-like uncharacterized protein
MRIQRIRLISPLFLLILLSSELEAQWELSYNETGKCFYCIDFLDQTTGVMGGGYDSFIYKTTDSGTSFNTIFSSSAYYYVTDIKSFNQDTIIACLLKTQTSPDSLLIIRSIDGGISWDTTGSFENPPLYKKIIHFPSENLGYLWCDSSLYKTLDNGVTWSLTYTFSGSINVNSIDFVNDTIGYLIGNDGVFFSFNGGNSWIFQYNFPSNYLSLGLIDFVSDSVGFTTVYNNLSYCVIFKSLDYGQSWFQTDSFNYFSIATMQFLNDSIGYVGGQFNMFRTDDGGYTWVNQNSFYQGFILINFGDFIIDICMVNDSNGFVVTHCMGDFHRKLNGGLSNIIGMNDINRDPIIFPNPSNGKISINSDRIEKIEVLNMHGNVIYIGKESEIDLSNKTKGIYIVKVITDKETITRKLIKQ